MFVRVYSINWVGYKDPSTAAMELKIQTLSYKYEHIPDLFAFECVFVNGLKGASIADKLDQTLSTYPSLIIDNAAGMERGWLTWAGNSERYNYTPTALPPGSLLHCHHA